MDKLDAEELVRRIDKVVTAPVQVDRSSLASGCKFLECFLAPASLLQRPSSKTSSPRDILRAQFGSGLLFDAERLKDERPSDYQAAGDSTNFKRQRAVVPTLLWAVDVGFLKTLTYVLYIHMYL